MEPGQKKKKIHFADDELLRSAPNSIAVAILFHACQLFHIVALTCLPVIDTEERLGSEQGQAGHIARFVLDVLDEIR